MMMESFPQLLRVPADYDERGKVASVFVQADDFSGAAEVGYCFVEHGLAARVLLTRSSSHTAARRHDGASSTRWPVTAVVVSDTHSRGLAGPAAEALVKDAFSRPEASIAHVMFKKIDSLWRGNISSEITALTGLGHHVVVAGALPQLQRTVVEGRPLVAGAPLAETGLWQAEAAAPPLDIPSLLRPGDPTSVHITGLDVLRSSALTTNLARLLNAGQPRVLVADGQDEQDLEHVVDALLALGFQAEGRRIVLAGTGGAANVLARRLSAQTARNAQSTESLLEADATSGQPVEAERPALAVVGSASNTAQAQLALLDAEGFTVIRLHPSQANAAGAYASRLAETTKALQSGANVALTLAPTKIDPANAPGIVRALSKFAALAAEACPADLILTGGETAREVLDAVGRSSLVPLAAVQHGAVLSRADDGTLVGTKPGSFGDDLALLELYHAIRQHRGRSAQAPANTLPRKTSEQLEQQ